MVMNSMMHAGGSIGLGGTMGNSAFYSANAAKLKDIDEIRGSEDDSDSVVHSHALSESDINSEEEKSEHSSSS